MLLTVASACDLAERAEPAVVPARSLSAESYDDVGLVVRHGGKVNTRDESRLVGKVQHVDTDETTAYVQLMNGTILPVSMDDEDEFQAEDVVLVGPRWEDVDPAPSELWPQPPWVGTIRVLMDGEAVVDIDGRLRTIDRGADLDLVVGNVVEGNDTDGIVRVVADRPLPRVEIALGEPFDVADMRETPDGELSYDDFGGYEAIKEKTKELIEFPLKYHEQLLRIGARSIKGVLFTGDSGTGKTLLGRIIANRAQATFYKVSGPEIVSKWVGSSEDVLRQIFTDARENQPSIIFFDEIDSVAPRRADDSHEATRRLVGQLLTLMDGFRQDNVMVIATTNRPQDLDDALRRPGRFDWQIHFPYPDRADREAILMASARNLHTTDDLPHALVAQKTTGWSPAELAAIWSDAALLAVSEERDRINAEDYFGGYERIARQREVKAATRRDNKELDA